MAAGSTSFVAASLALLFLGCSQSPEEEAKECVSLGGARRLCGPRSVTVPIVGSDGSARVEARINGKPVQLLLDTGAEMTVISPEILGTANEVVVRSDELCIGDLCLENEDVYSWDTPFSTASGPLTNGFVGMRTLKDFRLELDHAESASLHYQADLCPGTSAPLTFNQYGIPSVEVSVHTLPPSSVSIDTGATFTLLSPATSAALDPATLEPKTPAPLCTVNGCQDGVAFTSSLPTYCVGSACENDLTVKYPAFDAVGMTFFARRRSMFDFQGSALWFCD